MSYGRKPCPFRDATRKNLVRRHPPRYPQLLWITVWTTAAGIGNEGCKTPHMSFWLKFEQAINHLTNNNLQIAC
jgi:hypothetical protein